jgi:hypothetical protein
MAVKSVWTNPDGLRVAFGTNQAVGALVGSPCTYGSFVHMNAIIEAGRLSLSGGQIDPDANNVIPAKAVITRALLVVHETFVSPGTNGTLDLGVSIADGTYTGADEDGIDVAIAEAALLAGSVIACDGALVGAGTARQLAVPVYLSYDVDTSLFTAGKAELIVEYFIPMVASLTDPD